MKTKHFFLTALAAVCAMSMTMMFTACGNDDNDDNNGGNETSTEVTTITAHYTVTFVKEMTQLCDYTITYYGNDNQLKTEVVTWKVSNETATWEKDVKSSTLPALFGAKITAKLKDGVQLEGVSISNVYPSVKRFYMEGLTASGKTMWSKTSDIGSVGTKAGSTGPKLPAYIQTWDEHGGVFNASYSVDKNGNQTSLGKIE